MTSKIQLCASVMIAIAIHPANAAEYRVWGFGNRSCGSWVSDKQDQGMPWKNLIDIAWAEGFLTAMDRGDPAINAGSHRTDAEALSAWMDNYCTSHPLDSIDSAVEMLSAELSKR